MLIRQGLNRLKSIQTLSQASLHSQTGRQGSQDSKDETNGSYTFRLASLLPSRQIDVITSAGTRNDMLPTYDSATVSQHADPSQGRIWVTFKEGGGIHAIRKVPHRNLDPSDVDTDEGGEDPFSTDPKRHPPFNAEPPLQILADSYITPNDIFYVRNHLPVPVIEEGSYELDIEGIGEGDITLNLKDLKTKYPKHTIRAAIQCGGNRRTEMNERKPLRGLPWKGAAIGNAEWSGVRLSDVLASYGFLNDDKTLDKYRDYHVQFEGYDVGADGNAFGASIPLSRALDPNRDVLLAYEMNGEELPRDHGYPLRVVAPGTDYKSFNPSVNWDNVNWEKSSAIMDMPVTSAICRPSKGEKISLNKGQSSFKARGYAWSGGGSEVIRMDMSVDGGASWFQGRIVAKDEKARENRHYSWVIWEADIPVAKGQREVEIIGKAVDSNLNVQPEVLKTFGISEEWPLVRIPG
ncbi:CG7280 CG7280PAlike, partial [Caligus rogercresseyi]